MAHEATHSEGSRSPDERRDVPAGCGVIERIGLDEDGRHTALLAFPNGLPDLRIDAVWQARPVRLVLADGDAADVASEAASNMGIALAMLREWSLGGSFNARVALTVRKWIDDGMMGAVPWPGGAFFDEWAEGAGLEEADGFTRRIAGSDGRQPSGS